MSENGTAKREKYPGQTKALIGILSAIALGWAGWVSSLSIQADRQALKTMLDVQVIEASRFTTRDGLRQAAMLHEHELIEGHSVMAERVESLTSLVADRLESIDSRLAGIDDRLDEIASGR